MVLRKTLGGPGGAEFELLSDGSPSKMQEFDKKADVTTDLRYVLKEGMVGFWLVWLVCLVGLSCHYVFKSIEQCSVLMRRVF